MGLKVIWCAIVLELCSGSNTFQYIIFPDTEDDKSYGEIMNSVKSEDQIQNEQFEDLISEIFIHEVILCDFIIHHDTLASIFINNVMKKTNDKILSSVNNTLPSIYSPVILILNYNSVGFTESMVRAPRRYTIHIICLRNPLNFDARFIKGLKSSDVVIFLCQKNYETCKTAFDEGDGGLDPYFLFNTNFLNKVFLTLVLEHSNDRVRLYEVCYYCGALARILSLKLEESFQPRVPDVNTNIISNISKMVNEENNWEFHGHRFTVGFPLDEMNFQCEKLRIKYAQKEGTSVYCENLLYLEGKILKEMKKRLNINVELVYFEENMDGAYENLVNIVQRGLADWAVGSISITASRLNKVEFTYAVNSAPSKVIYGVDVTFFEDGLNMIYVFSISTWLLVSFTLVIISGVVYISNRNSSKIHSKSLSRIFWVVGFVLTEQSQHVNLKTFGGRVLFFWLLCSINITTLYKAKLTSFITMPPRDVLRNLDKLVKEGYSLNLIDAIFIAERLTSSTDKTLQKLSGRVSFHPSMCKTFKEIIGKKRLLIDEQDLISDAINRRCREENILLRTDVLKLRVTEDDLFPSSQGWVFKKETPYLGVINNYILQFHESGLSKKWGQYMYDPPHNHAVYFDGRTIVDKSGSSEEDMQFYGLFVLWIIGIVLSIFCFMLEVTVFFFHNYKENQLIIGK